MKSEHRIVVLGAGYTGLLCAIRLARRTRRTGVRVTLVNPSPRFTERLRMHQIVGGQELAVHQISDILRGTGVVFVRGTATAIDAEHRAVAVDTPDGPATLTYDSLVYALGSSTDTSTVPGADEHAVTLNSPRVARRFAERLAELALAGGAVNVCGGGLTGVEAATEIAESHPGLRVTLISRSEPGPLMNAKARAHLHAAFERLGITLRVGSAISKVLPEGVELADGALIPADACLWTTGVRVPALAADAGIAVDERGLIVVDATLRSTSHPQIHAIGDAAAVRQAWGQVHGTCQSGLPAAAYTADSLAGRLRGKSVKPFRFGYFHQPVSLGRRDAVIQFTHADDTPRRWFLSGRAAVAYKETISGSPLKMYRLSRRVSVSASLSKGGRATRAARNAR
ncbi:NAD(P)/FAD-dependent oxidoreductase [Streptomyces sp. NPDC056486]|uniref:NAD(P)/FAD-dependent oxidoreductase n=1 Tax=Streptomyces sp. NPDC056486 TaxID=3345835 RepID=UPI0036BD0514